jgi:TATA-box binding protein (TBP) (component of TFIID and TFIIIB)
MDILDRPSPIKSKKNLKKNENIKEKLINTPINKTIDIITDNKGEINRIVPETTEHDVHNVAPEPTTLRISTMTAICEVNTLVKLDIFYEHLTKYVVDTPFTKEGVWFIIHDSKSIGYLDTKRKKAKKKSGFYNQVSVVVYLKTSDNNFKKINIKIFKNGKLQLTGITKDENGHKSLKMLMDIMNDVNNKHKKKKIMYNIDDNGKQIEMKEEIKYINFKKVMINSDFSSEFKIQRDKLHSLLVNNYNIYSKFDPCVYQGVNSKYYWNKKYKNYPCKGVCCCTKECKGKGTGDGNGDCKEITIATFQSGKIIITGAVNYEQLNDAYCFINGVFKSNYNEIKRRIIPLALPKPKKDKGEKKKQEKKIVMIKRNNIMFNNKLIKQQ